MSELTDQKALLEANIASMTEKKDFLNGVTRTYWSGQSKSDTAMAEWTGAGLLAYIDWHDAQGVNTTTGDQAYVDMKIEKDGTEDSSPAADLLRNADIITTYEASISTATTDLAAIQARIDNAEEDLAS